MGRDTRNGGDEADVLEIHLEEWGHHSWGLAVINTLSGSYGSAQHRFVARPPGVDHDARDHRMVSGTFPKMRLQDLDDIAEPNAWLDVARERLHELDLRLTADGWQRMPAQGKHWWALSYARGCRGEGPS